MRPARPNDPCPCGSQTKYKKCCGPSPITKVIQREQGLDARHRALLLIDAIEAILGLRFGATWAQVQSKLCADQVAEIHRAVAIIWPWRLPLADTLPRGGDALRAYFLGGPSPFSLGRNVWRMSLYTDEVWVPIPFAMPWRLRAEHPVESAQKYLISTLRGCHYMLQLKPWVEAGIVTPVPSIVNFDSELDAAAREATERRIVRLGLLQDGRYVDPGIIPSAHEGFMRTFAMLPEPHRSEEIARAFEGAPAAEIRTLQETAASLAQSDPLVLRQSLEEVGGQIEWTSSGDYVESARVMCALLGAFPYTNSHHRWSEMKLMADETSGQDISGWTELSQAFHGLDFQFLDNVDSRFALEMREKGRLSSFRLYLRELWAAAASTEVDTAGDATVREFKDRLMSEHRMAQEEWSKIDRDLLVWSATSLGGGALVSGLFHLEPALALPVAIGGAVGLMKSTWARKEFKVQNPMSLFIDLSRHR